MSYLLLNGATPVEYRMLPPDEMTEERGTWEVVADDDPRVAQLLALIPTMAGTPTTTPSWGAFRLGLLDDGTTVGQSFLAAIASFGTNSEINRIKNNALMNEVSQYSPYLPYLIATWNTLVSAAAYVPGAGVIDGWNQLAVLCNIPLQWLPDGTLSTT
jgi:hypothetical protein